MSCTKAGWPATSPELAKANSGNLGVCLMRKDGTEYSAGDCNIPFTMQSISKTFSLILALQTAGYDKVFSKIGMEPTGDRFDSILQLELKDWRPFNPMINAGAIVTASCIESPDPFQSFLDLVRRLCANPRISLNESVYRSEKKDRHPKPVHCLPAEKRQCTGWGAGRGTGCVLPHVFRDGHARDLAHYG